jgi:hypothetical protein
VAEIRAKPRIDPDTKGNGLAPAALLIIEYAISEIKPANG